MRGERVGLGLILMAIVGSLAWRSDQPIVENYVGRQIPTAMVARNLDRGSGFLNPTLDSAPFPNRFLVEPPIYAAMVVSLKRWFGFVWDRLGWPVDGFGWERSGRLTSALMTTVGAAAFYGLVRRREGPVVALVALGSFGIFPVTLRYGRAFQPDATMLGFVLLGLWSWDEFAATSRSRWAWLGGLALAVALAVKVTVAWVLIPFALIPHRWPPAWRVAAAAGMLAPALGWYLYAWGEVRAGSVELGGSSGSLASADNAAIWVRSISPGSWLRWATWEALGRNLLVRAFSPVGFVLATLGWLIVSPRTEGSRDRLWRGWGFGVGLAILVLAAKWHHGYYWLVVAPWAAVGVARALVGMAEQGGWMRRGAGILGSFGLVLGVVQASSTWRDPPEWAGIHEAGDRIAALIPDDSHALLVAPEAVLFYADRPGPRLEFSPEAVRRAAGEWGGLITAVEAKGDPLALLKFYQNFDVGNPAARFRQTGGWEVYPFSAGLVADVGPVQGNDRRATWRAALRARPGVRLLIDEPDLFVAELGDSR